MDELFRGASNVTFMEPDEYGHLLYDDASFKRSRFYFWAIGCLSEFENNILDNLKALRSLMKEILGGAENHSLEVRNDIRKRLSRLELFCSDMEDVCGEIQRRLRDVRALRDGVSLFNDRNLQQVPDIKLAFQCEWSDGEQTIKNSQ